MLSSVVVKSADDFWRSRAYIILSATEYISALVVAPPHGGDYQAQKANMCVHICTSYFGLLSFSLLWHIPAEAQETGAPPAVGPSWGVAAFRPIKAQIDAWSTPRLITLRQSDDVLRWTKPKIASSNEEKLFSNREWRTYWQHQSGRFGHGRRSPAIHHGEQPRLTQWKTLAEDKVANQEVYFEAIESSEMRSVGVSNPFRACRFVCRVRTQRTGNDDPNAYERLRLRKVVGTSHRVQKAKKQVGGRSSLKNNWPRRMAIRS